MGNAERPIFRFAVLPYTISSRGCGSRPRLVLGISGPFFTIARLGPVSQRLLLQHDIFGDFMCTENNNNDDDNNDDNNTTPIRIAAIAGTIIATIFLFCISSTISPFLNYSYCGPSLVVLRITAIVYCIYVLGTLPTLSICDRCIT